MLENDILIYDELPFVWQILLTELGMLKPQLQQLLYKIKSVTTR